MLGNKNRKNKTVIGGVGIALLLCVLMVGMTMTGLVNNESPQGATNLVAADTGIEDDVFALPDGYEQEELEYDPSSELEGMRSLKEKGYLLEDGKTVKVIGNDPIHFMSDAGSWEEIDLNLKATLNGWEVTENNFRVYFPQEAGLGVALQVHENVDPIITGINPTVTIMHDEVNPMPIPYENAGESNEAISVGGNVIRYPVAIGFDLDYAVGKTDLKQNLIIRDRPVLDENVAWFGLTEQIRIPAGYGLYSGDELVNEEVTITQEELTIRDLETGQLLITIPAPQVMESGEEAEPYFATYFVQAFGENIVITTAVEGDWLMDEDRQFPLAIDPSMNVLSSSGGTCYYYAYCYTSTYRYWRQYSWARMYYFNWAEYSFSSATALGSTASVDKITYRFYVRYWYGSTSYTPSLAVMENCGYQYHTSYNNVPTRSCSGVFPSSALGAQSSYSYNGMRMKMSAWNSQSIVNQPTGGGWKTATFCNSATACGTGGSAYISSAAKVGGDVGITSRHKSSTTGTFYYYFYTYGSYNSYLQVTYSGVSDTKAPTLENAQYTDITTYKEGSRTFFAQLTDFTGIDTTTAGAPHLYYSVNGGSYTGVKATTIGTCSGSSARDCKFKAETADLSHGDNVSYYWAFRDTTTSANMATSPSGGTGTSPSSMSAAPSSTYWFFVETPENATFAENKLTVSASKVSAYPTTSPSATFDRQMTYYENSKEYVFEFDTSRCGTGSSSCFYTSSSTFYSNWRLMWTTSPSYTSWGYGGTMKGLDMLSTMDSGFLPISADDGAGMNVAFLYDTTLDKWAMVGIGDETTGIEQPLTTGTAPSYDGQYGYMTSHSMLIPGNITGTFGEFDWNGTVYSTSRANWMCIGTNGVIQFFRYSMTANPTCNAGYYYIQYTARYKWNGWAIASGYYGVQASGGKILAKVSNVMPLPDTTEPTIKHNALSDSHSRDRTISAKIIDGGDPPSGLNTSASAGIGIAPTLYYRVTDANGTVGSWTSTLLSQESGKTRAQCETIECTWSYELQDLERGSTVEYYLKAQDISPAASGVNVNNTSTYSFEVGDPNKMFIIEWHDMGYTSTYTCTYQAVMYDVTNEIEFKYDTGCRATYDYGVVGYQDKTRQYGATIDDESGYLNGANPFSSNYRIGTSSSTDHSWETFDLGLSELPTYDTVLRGTSSGSYYSFYCGYSYYFNRNPYTSACAANVALPSGFAFEYFGNEYNGSASTPDRVNIARHGAFNLIDNGATSPQQLLYYSWYSNSPDLPYSSGTGSSYVRPALLAPWFGYYSSYYCYDNSNLDCSIRTRVVPFEGKGTDVTSDITVDTTWAKIDSPIRINPSSSTGYLTINADLTIEPGVEIQVASGKGISFDGSCDQFTAEGNATSHIKFTGQNNGTWKGLAFTGACSTSTDNRHTLSYVDFSDTSEAAIVAGSRHGSSPMSNSNVGNFTMAHVTFSNVGAAFEHGSGQGTVVSVTEFSVSDASHSCFNFAEDTEVTLTNGTMDDCNSGGNPDGAALQNVQGSTAGSLYLENITIDDALVNLINVDFADVYINNVTATAASTQSGLALNATGRGVGSSLYVADFDAPDYSSGNVMSLDSIVFDNVDLGGADITIRPGGNVNTPGPSSANAQFDNLTSGDLNMARMSPYMYNLDVGALTLGGNAPGAGTILGENWDTDGIAFNGCGYKVTVDTVTTDYISGSCSTAAAPNALVLANVDATYTGWQNAFYARNTGMSIGSADVTMPSSYQNMAYAGTNGRIVLIDVDQDGNDCDGSGTCSWSSSSSGDIYFGGLATVNVYKDLGGGNTEPKAGHTVQATVVDASSAGMFIVGSHTTGSDGNATVWVVTVKDDTTTYSDHNLNAYGPAGQNETTTADSWYPSGGFSAGDYIELKLEPVPISLNGSNMDCDDLVNNSDAALGWNSISRTFNWEGKVTLTGNLNIDDCTIIMKHTWTVIADATNTPTITIMDGGKLSFQNGTTSQGNLKASSSSYPLELDIDGGILEFIDARARDIDGGLNIDSGTVTVSTGSIIYGAANQPSSQATVYVNGGTLDWDDSSIINNGQTGVGLMVESTGAVGADIDNIAVKNAGVGIFAKNAAPSISGFTLQDNDVGLDVEGGMSLPTIYRSTSLMGVSRGWATYAIDVSDVIDGDYLQVGWNAVYGGGSAHPAYSPLYSKYYMIYDRPRLALNDGSTEWNITGSTDTGFYSGTGGGATDYDCNRYGYSYNPWYGYSYREPTGYDWQEGTNTPSYYYPMNYWSFYSPSFYFSGWATPPEGRNGQYGYYNVCGHYSYYTYIPTGSDARFVMPIVDVSDASIQGATIYVDILHNGANNFQDRIEIVARSGDDPTDLGDWVREMGTASFSSGTITGAETGVEFGGDFAAGTFSDITISSPTDAGFEVVGSGTGSVDQLTVTGGDYGILMSNGASGTVTMTNVDVSGTANAGLYYIKDMKGAISGDFHNNTGAGIKFGSSSTSDIDYTSLSLADNGVGIETAGSGKLTIKYGEFDNTKDIVVTGGATVDFIEGVIDTTTVEVTSSGLVNRMREVNITVTDGTNTVSGANVVLQSASGKSAGSAVSDTSGVATGITFTTEFIDSGGSNPVPLTGYEAVTVAQIGTYSSTTADFRYKFDPLTLQDQPGNEHELVLTDNVDSRICYAFSSTAYDYIARCASGLSTSSSRYYSATQMTEYGYYGATPAGTENSGNGLNNQVVMVDVPIWYVDGNKDTYVNDSTMLVTAAYDSYDGMVMWSTYPYGARLYSNNSDWLGLANFDNTQYGFQIGYFNWNDVVPYIHNSTLSNVVSIVTEPGPYSWVKTPHFDIQNNVISHIGTNYNGGTSFGSDTMCLITSTGGVTNEETIIRNNILNDCPVGVYIKRQGYYFYYQSSAWGADDAIIENNTFNNVQGLGVWFSLSSYADDVVVRGNTFAGTTTPLYGVYAQDRRTVGLEISDNVFSNPEEPIYLRGALDYSITNNTIYGDGDASHAGIYTLAGDGVIDGNTLVDADGGILVDGIRYGYTVNVTNNDISQSAGRTAPTAVGIWAEDCGSSVLNSGGNTISVMENAIVTDGCDLVDVGSDLSAVAGSGGKLWTVGVNAQSFAPQSISISTGDTIRWRSNEYYNNSGTTEQHDVVSNDSLFDSGPMNLGSTFTYTFLTEGTYNYHCSLHPALAMWGTVTVTNATSGAYDSVGINIAGSNDDITLDGTEASGFSTTVSQDGGSLTIEGDAILSGNKYGVIAEDTDVVIDGAHLISGANGSAVYVTGTSTLDATDMDTSGKYGLNSDGVDFRWNGGESDAETALIVDGGAEGSVENVTWDDVTTQIDARDYSTVTSVGNTVTASKLILSSTSVIHEGNLLDLDITHKTNEPSDVGLLIQSTDGEQAAYVSPAYRTSFINADGDTDEWFNNVKNPSDDAMPGVMSSDGNGEDFLTTWDANYLHLALTDVDMGTADLQIYIDSSTGGDTTGQSWYVSHSLPFAADYVFWAEDGNDGNSGLKVNGFTGWTDVTASCSGLDSFIGYSADTDTEISIPWTCIGEPSDTVRLIVIVQDESTGAIESVHPDQTVASGATGQTFTEEMTLMLGHSDLADGDSLQNHLLIYRSYVGSNTPTDAKEYDVSVKVDAVCEEDWATVEDVSMATNVNLPIDIKRACPVITDLIDITVDEDSGLYTLNLTNKADDVQDDEETLLWTVSDDADPTNSPSMLLDSNLVSQELFITPDNDQFGTYTFHFEVEDEHGLTDSATIVFTVVNVNDAPIICNTERSDCMPVFSDDGAGNLNVLDEGFGSVSKVLGSAANATGSYIIDMASNDMANEQPQVYTWGASIKADEEVTVDPYWVQKKYSTVSAMFSEIGAVMTAAGGWQDLPITGDPDSITPNGTYVLPTLNDVSILTYLLAQNGCGSVWYQEYMDSSGNKVTAVRSDDGCDSTIDTTGKVYSGLNYTDFWMEAYGVDTEDSAWDSWDEVFPDGFTTTSGYNPCPAYTVSVINNELTINENEDWELGGDCTIVLSLNDDGGYCQNTYLGRTTNVKASCVSYTWLIDYPIDHPLYGPITVTGCYNLYLGLSSFIPEYLPDGSPSGMTQTICQAYGWVDENTDADDMEVVFSVTPVNDAPEVVDWNANSASDDYAVIMDGNGDVPNFPWKVTLTEDDENVDNLTYDLSMMKHDNDHEDEDLKWTIVKADTCDYENYFSATINGDDIVFDLIKDATTNAPEWEVDYLNNGGKHQKVPLSGEFCPVTLYLHDTEQPPSYIPNYDMSTANYQQGEDSVTLYIRVDNVAENVPDYYLDSASGFDFNQVSNIMPKTFVPTTVTIGHGGDEGPYNYDHMLEVTFHSDGYNNDDPDGEEYVTLGTQYVMPPAYGEEIEVTDLVYITSTTSRVWVEVDVLTCVAETCDLSASPADRFFGYSFPYAHACIDSNGVQQDAWSCPGEIGSSSVDAEGNPSAVTLNNKRRPMLEDQDWCNNLMSTDDNGSDCAQPRTFGKTTIATGQDLPTVVRLIGIADVPSFAPSIIAISAAGLFVSALVLQSRREEEEEALEEMTLEDDEQAVSPVIATILMVAITVVLSGVIYVWASSLADTSAKGVPRITFTLDSSQALGGDAPFHRITVTGSQVELATQAVQVLLEYTDSAGESHSEIFNLADTTVYGFFPGNSETLVTFTDAVGSNNGVTKSSFDTGDTIYIRTSTADGEPMTNLYVSVSYNPATGSGGSVLRTWSGL